MMDNLRDYWLPATAALWLVACGGNGDNTPTDAGGGDASTPDPTALYILHSATQSSDTRLNYFTPVDSLTEDAEIDYADSIEVPGRARLYAQPGLGFFTIGNSEDVTLTRYDITGQGEITMGDQLSFASLGVSSLGAQAVYFASATQAYYKDPDQAQIIEWNPTSMEIESVIELPDSVLKEDVITSFGDWAVRDQDAFITVTWYSEAYDRVAEGTALIHVDPETGQVEITEDDRCRELVNAATIDGTIYYASGVINAFGHAVHPDDAGQPACMLRIQPGETAFDDGYMGSIASQLPEDTSGAVITSTGADLWAQVVDLSIAPTEPGTTYSQWYDKGWNWWRMPLGGSDATQVTTMDGGYSSFAVTTAGGAFLLSDTEPDYSSTTLVDVSGGSPEPGATFPGFALDVARVH